MARVFGIASSGDDEYGMQQEWYLSVLDLIQFVIR